MHSNRLKLFFDSRDRFFTRSHSSGTPDNQARPAADFRTNNAAESDGNTSHAQPRQTAKAATTSAAAAPAAATATVPATATGYATTVQPLVSGQPQLQQTDAQSSQSQDDWYEIADILKHKRIKGVLHYLLKWSVGGRDWIPIQDITQRGIDDYYLKRQRLAARRRRRKRT